MFGKESCFNCSEKAKKMNMAKTKDGFFLCLSCQALLSRYYPGCFSGKKEEVAEHLKYMDKMRDVYENAFLKDENKIIIKNSNLGIAISESLGLFKVIDDEWGEFNPHADTELFRLDQINKYEIYNNHVQSVYGGEGAFIDCGVKIYMNNSRKEEYNKYKLRQNQTLHPYVFELDVVTASEENLTPADTFENQGMSVAHEIISKLDELFGASREEFSEARKLFGQRADKILS